MGLFDKFRKKEPDPVFTDSSNENDPFGSSAHPSDPFSSDPLSSDPLSSPTREPFSTRSFGDPMGESFSSESAQSSQQYPMSAPFPGSNRALPERQSESQQFEGTNNRDVELILAKLDAIKAELDSLHQRVRTIERRGEKPAEPKKYAW